MRGSGIELVSPSDLPGVSRPKRRDRNTQESPVGVRGETWGKPKGSEWQKWVYGGHARPE